MVKKISTQNISYFSPPVQNTKPIDKVSLTELYQLITGDTLKDITVKVRTMSNPQLVRDLKASSLPHITPSGIFYSRCDDGMKYHSEILCMDIDDIDSEEEFIEIRQRLIEDKNFTTLLLFRSPSGCGIKWFISIDLNQCGHRKWFEAVRNYLYQTYSIIADEKCINISQSCFLCHDPEAYACEEIINQLSR